MTPEQETLHDLLEQIRASDRAMQESLELLSPAPADRAAFEALSMIQRVAATAFLKQFEQLEGGLARTFRTMLRMLGQSLKGLYAYDIANHMIELGVLDDTEAWVDIVKLRNELAHEYPFEPEFRFDRLKRAYTAVPLLRDASSRLTKVIRTRRLLP